MLSRAALVATLLALASCGAPGTPDPRIDLSPRDGSVAVVGAL